MVVPACEVIIATLDARWLDLHQNIEKQAWYLIAYSKRKLHCKIKKHLDVDSRKTRYWDSC